MQQTAIMNNAVDITYGVNRTAHNNTGLTIKNMTI